VYDAGRSQPGHLHPLSLTFRARLVDPGIFRVVRPTSITCESALSKSRATLQSHASLATAAAEIGSDSSRSAAGAPQR